MSPHASAERNGDESEVSASPAILVLSLYVNSIFSSKFVLKITVTFEHDFGHLLLNNVPPDEIARIGVRLIVFF
jgi:hypothetical protein